MDAPLPGLGMRVQGRRALAVPDGIEVPKWWFCNDH